MPIIDAIIFMTGVLSLPSYLPPVPNSEHTRWWARLKNEWFGSAKRWRNWGHLKRTINTLLQREQMSVMIRDLYQNLSKAIEAIEESYLDNMTIAFHFVLHLHSSEEEYDNRMTDALLGQVRGRSASAQRASIQKSCFPDRTRHRSVGSLPFGDNSLWMRERLSSLPLTQRLREAEQFRIMRLMCEKGNELDPSIDTLKQLNEEKHPSIKAFKSSLRHLISLSLMYPDDIDTRMFSGIDTAE